MGKQVIDVFGRVEERRLQLTEADVLTVQKKSKLTDKG